VTSIITFTEVLSFKKSNEIISDLKSLLLEVPNLEMKDVSRDIAEEAARIRRTYGFYLPDAIQLATALNAKASIFITNDIKLRKCKEIKILSLRQFTKM
jgi:predicted nucleic acid-binding protein